MAKKVFYFFTKNFFLLDAFFYFMSLTHSSTHIKQCKSHSFIINSVKGKKTARQRNAFWISRQNGESEKRAQKKEKEK